MLESILTNTTCGSACWEARETVCRCSCGGRNHGCIKTADGVRPERMAKIDGVRYVLKAIGDTRNRMGGTPDAPSLYEQARAFNSRESKPTRNGYVYPWYPTDKGAPARIKTASREQIARWEELASYRPVPGEWRGRPELLWVREDVASNSSVQASTPAIAATVNESRAHLAMEELESIPQ